MRASARVVDRALLGLACVLAILAVAAHLPGHVSMDSSEQLYEAFTGKSVSWSPPFMSALLYLLGGGARATASFVILTAVLTYGGLALALAAGRRQGANRRGVGRIAADLAIAILIANPIIFLYVGIIWKDVLLAALCAAASGLLLQAHGLDLTKRRVLCVLALLLLVPTLLVRQQGILLAPPLAAVAAAGIVATRLPISSLTWWLRWLGVIAVYAILCWSVAAAVRQTVQGTDDKSTAIGFAAVQRYDLTGMIALGEKPTSTLPGRLASPLFAAAVKRAYSPDRIDFVLNDPKVVEGFWGLDSAAVSNAWWSLMREQPGVYVEVKARQFSWLAGLERLDLCLPLHVGVEGNPDYLRAVGLPNGVDRHDLQLYALGMWARHLVLYRHWFYIAMLVVCVGHLVATWRAGGRSSARGLAFGLLAFYGSYALTTIACDFRYLYPGLVGVSVLAVYLLARGRVVTASINDMV